MSYCLFLAQTDLWLSASLCCSNDSNTADGHKLKGNLNKRVGKRNECKWFHAGALHGTVRDTEEAQLIQILYELKI